MNCPRCSEKNPDFSMFCQRCGFSLVAQNTQPYAQSIQHTFISRNAAELLREKRTRYSTDIKITILGLSILTALGFILSIMPSGIAYPLNVQLIGGFFTAWFFLILILYVPYVGNLRDVKAGSPIGSVPIVRNIARLSSAILLAGIASMAVSIFWGMYLAISGLISEMLGIIFVMDGIAAFIISRIWYVLIRDKGKPSAF